jgi:hypothetical protein
MGEKYIHIKKRLSILYCFLLVSVYLLVRVLLGVPKVFKDITWRPPPDRMAVRIREKKKKYQNHAKIRHGHTRYTVLT